MLRRGPRSRPRRSREDIDRADLAPAPDLAAIAVGLLARRDFSEAQLRQRLLGLSEDTEAIDAIIKRLVADGTLDDRRVAGVYAHRAARVKSRGRLRILRELAEAGISDDVARAAVDAVFESEDAAALLERAVSRHVRGPLHDRQAYRRVFAALVRRGFGPAEIRAALKRHVRGEVADVDEETPGE